MATIKFTETFATVNANQTVKFNYAGEENVGVIIGYADDLIIVQTDSPKAWELKEEGVIAKYGVTITSKEPLDANPKVLFINYEDITWIVTDAESIAKSSLNAFLYALIMAIMFLVFLFCCSNATYSQVKVSKEKTEVLASVRLGNAKLMAHEAVYAVTMTDKTNSGIKANLQLHGYSFDSGIVVIVLGNKENAIQVLEYLANNKPAKGEEVTIEGNEGVTITYDRLFGGWTFHQHGMEGDLGRGEAKKFLKAINK
ncbi:hypothetical protein PM116P4_00034 [Parabacteroides phage PM116P4]|nr:hypothetical protein PM116P4_00034 [Parabacteroides phage PM116P4]WAX17527.1 hypothetical protein PM116P5_00011 [Parabacteroides phage PM116P5]